MKSRNKIAAIVACAILASLGKGLIANAADYFDGNDGDSGGTGGGSCDAYYSGSAWCSKVRSWYYYEYQPGVDYGQINVSAYVPSGSFSGLSLTTSVSVPGKEPYNCDNTSSGFYVSGITLFQHYSSNPTWSFNDKIWTPGNGQWDGRFIGLAKYRSGDVYYNGSDRVRLENAPLPMDAAGNKIRNIYAVPKSEVEARWNGTDGTGKAAKAQASEAGWSDDLSNYSYFCAGDKVSDKKQGQDYKGSAQIKINKSNSTNFSGSEIISYDHSSDSGAANPETKSEVITINQGSSTTLKVSVEAYGKVGANGGAPEGYDEGYKSTQYTLSATSSNGSSSSNIISGVDKTGTTADGYIASGSPAKDIELRAGVTYTLCAVNTYASTYRSDKGGFGNNETVKACVKIKYEPVVAEIDSETTLTVGADSKKSGKDASDTLSLGEVNYGAGAIEANWSYNLSSSKRCFEGDFADGACKENNTSITASFTVPYKRSGSAYSDSGNQTATLSSPGYSADPGSNSKSYDLLPGETIRESQGISHKSGVRTDGAAVSGAKDERSSMTLEATAKDAICSLNNQPFGLGNPVNYGRLTVVKNANRAYVYGNNLNEGNPTWSDAGAIWLKPNDTVKLSYEACIGEQIKKDKASGKGWSETISEDDNNAVLAVGTSGSLLDGSHYTETGNAVDQGGSHGRNIASLEVIGNTISGHVLNGYEFVGTEAVNSKEAAVWHLGQTINNDFGNLGSDGVGSYLSGCGTGNCYARATMKIPYNYILNPTIRPGENGVVTLGDQASFNVSVGRSARKNTQVGDTYATDVKPSTKAKYASFALPTDYSYSALQDWADNHKTWDGDITDNLSAFIHANLSTSIRDLGSGDISTDDINAGNETSVKLSATDADADHNKLCVAAAVYPADSHNVRDEDINSDDQSAALTNEFGNGAYTRISVSCKTVGKYPTMSVEGNGIVAGGEVNGAKTQYSGRNFGSWTEYGLIAYGVKNFASAASMAYLDAQTSINASTDTSRAGIGSKQFDSVQTLGNMGEHIGLRDSAQASLYAAQAQSFADDVRISFFGDTPDGSTDLKKFNNSTYVNTNFGGDVVIDSGLADVINSKSEQVVIYSVKDIKISNTVTQLNAILVADGKVDTCAEADQGGDNGQLLESCYNPLVINGVVYSKGSIALDRVYGGGSVNGMNLDPNTLMQRAEIFSFDPKIVEWGYNYKRETQPFTTTYIEELSTRY